MVDPYDFELTDDEVELFREHFNKQKKLSEEELRYYVKEWIIHSRFFVNRYMNFQAIKLQSYVTVELKKKGYSDEEIEEWFRYKKVFLEQKKSDQELMLDTKYLEIARDYSNIINNSDKIS